MSDDSQSVRAHPVVSGRFSSDLACDGKTGVISKRLSSDVIVAVYYRCVFRQSEEDSYNQREVWPSIIKTEVVNRESVI